MITISTLDDPLCDSHWPYSVTQLPVEFLWHWRLSNAEISVITVILGIISIRSIILVMNFMRICMLMVLMIDISALDDHGQIEYLSRSNVREEIVETYHGWKILLVTCWVTTVFIDLSRELHDLVLVTLMLSALI